MESTWVAQKWPKNVGYHLWTFPYPSSLFTQFMTLSTLKSADVLYAITV